MANYYGTTVSEGGKLKEESKDAFNAIVEKYVFGNEDDLHIEINSENQISIWGEDGAQAYRVGDEDHDADVMDDFLNELSPLIETPLIVKEVGNEKCRYVCAYAYVLIPNETVVSVSLDEAIEKVLKIDLPKCAKCGKTETMCAVKSIITKESVMVCSDCDRI